MKENCARQENLYFAISQRAKNYTNFDFLIIT